MLPFASWRVSCFHGTRSGVGIWLSPVGAARAASGNRPTTSSARTISGAVFTDGAARLESEEVHGLVELSHEPRNLGSDRPIARRRGGVPGDAIDEPVHLRKGGPELVDELVQRR